MRRSSARLLAQLWHDDGGALLATEFVTIATLLVVGTVAGLVAVRNSTNSGLAGFADSVRSVSQAHQIDSLSSAGGASLAPVKQPMVHPGQPQPSFLSFEPVTEDAAFAPTFKDTRPASD